jgi:DNA-binding response OmpR family regulator
MSNILLGETQEDLATAMRDWFAFDHYAVDVESNGARIIEVLRDKHYDLVVLEIALPGLDGIGVVRHYRAIGGSAPIVLLAGRHSSKELQAGLDAGADAFIVKPFQLSDLGAQLRALLRRPMLQAEKILIVGDLTMDTCAGTVKRNDVLIHLHPMEFKLLQFLLRHPNQVFNAQAIFERVWQKDESRMDDTVRTHVRTLRQKIDSPGNPSIITTVRGFGYKAELR